MSSAGGTSAESILSDFRAAMNDPEIDGVVYCHATPRRDDEILTRLSPIERYAEDWLDQREKEKERRGQEAEIGCRDADVALEVGVPREGDRGGEGDHGG